MKFWRLTSFSCASEVFYGGFGWHRLDVIAEFGEVVIVQYHIVSSPILPSHDSSPDSLPRVYIKPS